MPRLGRLWREESGAWSVVHVTREWVGSPVSGQYSGGCPDETDRMNREGRFGGLDGARPERDRIASAAAMHAATAPAPRTRAPRYAYTASGARMTERRGTVLRRAVLRVLRLTTGGPPGGATPGGPGHQVDRSRDQ